MTMQNEVEGRIQLVVKESMEEVNHILLKICSLKLLLILLFLLSNDCISYY